MGERRSTRRRVLGVVAVGLGVGAAGCLGRGSTNESDSSTSSPARSRRTAATTAVESTSAPTDSSTATAETRSGTGSGTGTRSETSTDAGATERGAYTVGMYTDLYFDPIGLFVKPGETVSFELVSGVHSATAYHPDNEAAFELREPKEAPAWDTGVFDTVGTFRNVTFEVPGTYDYYCIPHKQLGMVGRIVCGEPGGPATESPNPDGDLPDSAEIAHRKSIPYEGPKRRTGNR